MKKTTDTFDHFTLLDNESLLILVETLKYENVRLLERNAATLDLLRDYETSRQDNTLLTKQLIVFFFLGAVIGSVITIIWILMKNGGTS